MTQPSTLYVCSSRRHLYIAAGLALAGEGESHLLVIDQASADPDATVAALGRQPGLFASITVRPRPRGRRAFRAELAACRALVAHLRPGRIVAGNDRKYQFQYACKSARDLGLGTRGVYIDDGTGSYESGIYLYFWRGLLDRSLVALAKRFAVGFWYHRARYFGGSRWVDECLVQHPKLMPAPVQSRKQVLPLLAEIYRQPERLAVLEACFLSSRPDARRWADCQAIIVLPYSKHVPRRGPAFERFVAMLREAVAGCAPVGIKYHPRESREYLPPVPGDVLIDREVPAEILFSQCRPRRIVGDTSSALLSAQWLQTGAQIISLCPQGDLGKPIPRLLARAGIRVDGYPVD